MSLIIAYIVYGILGVIFGYFIIVKYFYPFLKDIRKVFLGENEYPNDDERLYNPLTGKYYDLEFEGSDTIYSVSTNQTNILKEEDFSQQQKFHRFKEYLLSNDFILITEENEIERLYNWIQEFELSSSLIDFTKDVLYFQKDESIYILFTGKVYTEIGLYTICQSKTFKGTGFIWPKDKEEKLIDRLFFRKKVNTSISDYVDKHFHVKYDDLSVLKKHLSQKALRLIELTPELQMEFKNGTIILFDDEETSIEQLAKLRVLARELK